MYIYLHMYIHAYTNMHLIAMHTLTKLFMYMYVQQVYTHLHMNFSLIHTSQTHIQLALPYQGAACSPDESHAPAEREPENQGNK